MNKKWEEELKEIMFEYGYDDAVEPVKKWLAKQIDLAEERGEREGIEAATENYKKNIIPAIRTKLLARVRDVVDKYESTKGISGSDTYEIGKNHGRQEFKEFLLKKLEIISEEGKE